MTPIKDKKQQEVMIIGGRKLNLVLKEVLKKAKVGVALYQLNDLARDLILKSGGQPSFEMVKNYRWATCLNVNQGVVHGIPGKYRLKDGDLLSVDVGLFYQGLHTDMAQTIIVGTKNKQKEEFLKAGEIALQAAIAQAKEGKRIGHISQAIEINIKKAGFQPVKLLTGHGVGKELHEDPPIPCFLAQEVDKTPLCQNGMALAIEVIYAQGKPNLILGKDNWTIETADGCLSGLFEKTVLIRGQKPLILG